jgi:hypothetical protein
MEICPSDVYGILAAPPCTEFSRAKTTAPRDFEAGMETVQACMEIIWHCQIFGKLSFWALENPDGLLYKFLGRPAYRFEQWQFGFPLEKPTVLWGMFKNPKPTVVVKPEIDKHVSTNTKRRVNNNSRLYASPIVPDEYKSYISALPSQCRRAAARAITPAGFAQAFFRANR